MLAMKLDKISRIEFKEEQCKKEKLAKYVGYLCKKIFVSYFCEYFKIYFSFSQE